MTATAMVPWVAYRVTVLILVTGGGTFVLGELEGHKVLQIIRRNRLVRIALKHGICCGASFAKICGLHSLTAKKKKGQ